MIVMARYERIDTAQVVHSGPNAVRAGMAGWQLVLSFLMRDWHGTPIRWEV